MYLIQDRFNMVIKKYDEVSNNCGVCLKTVYAAEEKLAGGLKWHKACFKCSACNKRLDSTTCNENGGSLYCKVSNFDNEKTMNSETDILDLLRPKTRPQGLWIWPRSRHPQH